MHTAVNTVKKQYKKDVRALIQIWNSTIEMEGNNFWDRYAIVTHTSRVSIQYFVIKERI